MAHKALKAHTSPGPKSNARTLSAHLFAPTSHSTRLAPGLLLSPRREGKMIN
jgi:hypothetical protein